MSKVVISESLFNAMLEQLGYWADYCDDSEGYLSNLIEAVSKDACTFTKEEIDVLKKHVDLSISFEVDVMQELNG